MIYVSTSNEDVEDKKNFHYSTIHLISDQEKKRNMHILDAHDVLNSGITFCDPLYRKNR
jgi:hypothetical protein